MGPAQSLEREELTVGDSIINKIQEDKYGLEADRAWTMLSGQPSHEAGCLTKV